MISHGSKFFWVLLNRRWQRCLSDFSEGMFRVSPSHWGRYSCGSQIKYRHWTGRATRSLASSKKRFPSRNTLDISWSFMIFNCIVSPCPCEPRHATSLHRLLPNTLRTSSLNGTKKTNGCQHQRIMPLDCEPARPCCWERDSGIKCARLHLEYLDTLQRNWVWYYPNVWEFTCSPTRPSFSQKESNWTT